MIEFRQKEFSEYDAMRSLYVELMKYGDRNKYEIISSSELIPKLKGNNIIIERFVISTSFAHKDKYRMYLKIGAKAKLPDEVRLPGRTYDKNLGNLTLSFNGKLNAGNNNNNSGDLEKRVKNLEQRMQSDTTSSTIGFKQKEFKGNNNGGDGGGIINSKFSPYINIQREVTELLGEAIKYDKKSRSLVLEFNSIRDAISALNILPFGLNYKICLLDSSK